MPNEIALRIPGSFVGWLWASKRNYGIPALGVFLAALNSFLPHLKPFLDSPWLTTVMLGVQAVMLGLLLLLMREPLRDESESQRASVAVDQFAGAWRTLWFFWFLEYVLLTVREAARAMATQDSAGIAPFLQLNWVHAIGETLVDTMNNLPTIALAVCYVILSERTVEDTPVLERTGETRIRSRALRLPWDKLITVLIAVAVVEFVIRLNGRTPFFPGLPAGVGDAFGWLSGLAAGLATALVIGRLESRFVGLPTWLTAILFLYAVVQPIWGAFPEYHLTEEIFLNSALAFKFVFFAVVMWLLESGVLLFYLQRAGGIIDNVAPDRARYLARVQRPLTVGAGEPPPSQRILLGGNEPRG
jgi:hypothetical protein